MKALQPFPSIALGAFSEDLVSSRRVVIFGNALSGLAETLVERGARLVHVYDENPARVAEATARSTSNHVSFAPLGPGGIAARDGAFDVGFVDEISQFATPSSIITRLRRALTARGVALVSTVNPDKKLMYSLAPESANALSVTLASTEKPLSYYDLYDLVTSEFDEVKMVGQTPFVGYALADFSPDTDVEFSIDTALVPGGAEEPEFFIAVCSHFPITTEAFCVVQMAAEALLGPHLLAPARATAALESNARQDVTPDTARILRQLDETQQLLTAEREARAKAETLLTNVNLELQHRDAWVAELEKRADTADQRADRAEAQLERLESRAKQQAQRADDTQSQSRQAELARQLEKLTQTRRTLETELAEANDELSRVKGALARLEQERDTLKAALEAAQTELREAQRQTAATTRLEEKLSTLESQYAAVRADWTHSVAELERAERQLAQQGEEVRRLRSELVDTERFAAVLLAQRDARMKAASDHLGSQGSACVDAKAAPLPPAIAPATLERTRANLGSTESTPEPRAEAIAVESTQAEATAAQTVAAQAARDAEPARTDIEETESAPNAGDGAPQVNRDAAPNTSPTAELEATVQALRWTIEELEQRLEAKSQEDALVARLHAAQQQLQRQAVLLRQYENKSPEGAPSGV